MSRCKYVQFSSGVSQLTLHMSVQSLSVVSASYRSVRSNAGCLEGLQHLPFGMKLACKSIFPDISGISVEYPSPKHRVVTRMDLYIITRKTG